MGRPPKSYNYTEDGFSYYESEARKNKHRYADSKYRSKVQFLYGKVKEIVKVKTTKDALLNDALKFILRKESEICKVIGESKIKEYRKEFLRFLYHEERLWKSEKDVGMWWSQVESSLNLKYSNQESVNDENSGFDNLCFEHNKEWASQPSEFHSSADYAPYLPDESTEHKGSIHIDEMNCTNDSLSCNASTLSNSSKENLNEPVYTPNSIWSPADISHFDSQNSQGVNLSGKIKNEFMPVKSGLFSMENPLETSVYQVHEDDSGPDSGLVSTSTFANL